MNSQIPFKTKSPSQFRRILAISGAELMLCLAAVDGAAQTYTLLHYFSGPDGSCPEGGVTVSGTTLYGTTAGGYGGTQNNSGTLFKANTDGSDYTVLYSFGGVYAQDGQEPKGCLVLDGTTLYGTTFHGGANGFQYGGFGTVYKINTDSTGYRVLRHLNSDDGVNPGCLILSGATLYGTAYSLGGSGVQGTVFSINTDGNGFSVLKRFTGPTPYPDGSGPVGALVLSGSGLYGVTAYGGLYNQFGTLFTLNTDGSGFSRLKAFAGGTDGSGPGAGLTESGGVLYGTTTFGGAANDPYNGGNGTVFKYGPNGGVIKRFAGDDGRWPLGSLVVSGTTVYGITCRGGKTNLFDSQGLGTVFKLNTDGSGFTVLKRFDVDDGIHPNAGLALSGTTLYGTARDGGPGRWGVLFSLSVAPPAILAGPQSQTAEVGITVGFSVKASGSMPLSYRWYFNSTNLIAAGPDSHLNLTNVQFSQSGALSVVVSNLFGTATSPLALLNVIAVVDRRPVPAINLLTATGGVFNIVSADCLTAVSDWRPLGTVSLTTTSGFYFDLTAPLPQARFYRAWQSQPTAMPPALGLHLVPALTLTGPIGSSVRVDGINQFGPIDAWVTLDKVTLTNTSQLYFDVSAPEQPPRLYRVAKVP